jgi:hypothetical protein
VLYTLLPPTGAPRLDGLGEGLTGIREEGGAGAEGIQHCAPRQIRGGMDRFLDDGGELRLFFPDCLPLAAPFILFRLKRQGFSGCYVRSTDRGLYVAARR